MNKTVDWGRDRVGDFTHLADSGDTRQTSIDAVSELCGLLAEEEIDELSGVETANEFRVCSETTHD